MKDVDRTKFFIVLMYFIALR